MCIFCKIVNGEIPNNTVHENEDFLALSESSYSCIDNSQKAY